MAEDWGSGGGWDSEPKKPPRNEDSSKTEDWGSGGGWDSEPKKPPRNEDSSKTEGWGSSDGWDSGPRRPPRNENPSKTEGWGSGGGWNSGPRRPPRNENPSKTEGYGSGGGWNSGPRRPPRNEDSSKTEGCGSGGGWNSGPRRPPRNEDSSKTGGWGSSDGWDSGPKKRPRNEEPSKEEGWGSGDGWDSGTKKPPRNEDSSKTEGWGSGDGWDSGPKKPSENEDPSKSEGWGSGDGWDSEPKKRPRNEEPSKKEGWGSGDAWDKGPKKSDDEIDKPGPYKPEELDLQEEARMQKGAGENFHKYQDQVVTCLPQDAVRPIDSFDQVVKSKLLMTNLMSQHFKSMTPVQKWAIPAIMDGHDLIACAQTGSGKTAAFLLPIIQTLLDTDLEPGDPNSDCTYPYCLIISPTRELANQIDIHAKLLCRDSMIKCHVIYGQVSTAHLKSKLMTGCHILVSTVGRLKDFVQRGWVSFKNIKFIVLDEGDRLVDDGFSTDLKGFFTHETMPPKQSRQTLFFSATFNDGTQVRAKEYLEENFVFLAVGRVGAANESIRQEFIRVGRDAKRRELKKILEQVPESDKTIVFTQTKVLADILAGFFNSLKLSSTSIHGDRHQSQREQAIKTFKKGEKRFLISSPVGNRGLDLPEVALVINYDLPLEIDEYVHRIGRTGRAGHSGRAISFYDDIRDKDLLPKLVECLKEAKQEIPSWMTGDDAPEEQPPSETPECQDSWD